MAASRGHTSGSAGQRTRPSDKVNPKTVDPVSNVNQILFKIPVTRAALINS